MKIIFSDNLIIYRNSRQMSQSKLAKLLNTTQRRVSYLECGAIEPDLATLWKLADIFDVSIDEVLGRSNL
ncbi:MAG: helix-turn-helix transcriptional regulator [Clostridia bacterium]